MGEQGHWRGVYAQTPVEEMSWHRPTLERSLTWFDQLGLAPEAHVLDAGAGASSFVDGLLARGHRRVTLVDLAEGALETTRARLGRGASDVTFHAADVTTMALEPRTVALWHDRAVFHFQVEPARCAAYVERIARSVVRGGHVLIATFALDGPERCSGLPVARYDAAGLLETLGRRFEHVRDERETHVTPAGRPQSFTYVLARRVQG